MRIAWSALCLSVIVATLGHREATACSRSLCTNSERFATFGVVSAAIARDGVVVFEWSRGSSATLPISEVLEHVTVSVVDGLGDDVPGAVEWRAEANAIVWTPSDVLTPGDALTLHLWVDNSGLVGSDAYEECGPDIERSIPLTVGDSLPAVPPVQTTISVEHEYTSTLDLDHLVCCDGAMPMATHNCAPEEIQWNEGHCEPTVQRGQFTLEWELAWDARPEISSNYVPRFVWEYGTIFGAPGASTLSSSDHVARRCGSFELISLADGRVVASEEGCFGEDLVDELGRVERDPSSGLMVCRGEPYVCAVEDERRDRWDPNRCEPWPGDDGGSDDGTDDGDEPSDGNGDASGDAGGDGGQDGGTIDRGCGCTSTPTVPPGLGLVLLAFGLLVPRRRAS